MDYKIIDFHTHAFPDKIAAKATENLHSHYKMKPVSEGYYTDLLECAARVNVSNIVVHATATKATQVENVNNYIASLKDEYNDLLIGFGTIHADYEDYKTELKRVVALGLRGIKLHCDFQGFDIDTPKMMPIYEEIVRLGLPILFHLGDRKLRHARPKRLARVLDEFPEMTAIGAHFGGVFMWDEAIEYLVGKDLYFDTSSALFELEIDKAIYIIKNHGEDKMLFGTDFPLADYDTELERFFKLPLNEVQRKKILAENAIRLLRL